MTNTLYHGVYFSELLYHVARMTEDKGRQLILADGQHSVLLSSHITSDLDRTADRVICIDNGSIIFDLPREDITDRAGIAHCTQAQAAELMACVEGARAVHHAYSVDVLVPNVAKRSRPSPRFPAIGQPLTTIYASR